MRSIILTILLVLSNFLHANESDNEIYVDVRIEESNEGKRKISHSVSQHRPFLSISDIDLFKDGLTPFERAGQIALSREPMFSENGRVLPSFISEHHEQAARDRRIKELEVEVLEKEVEVLEARANFYRIEQKKIEQESDSFINHQRPVVSVPPNNVSTAKDNSLPPISNATPAGIRNSQSDADNYHNEIYDRFFEIWEQPKTLEEGTTFECIVKLKISRSGIISNSEIVQKSGNKSVDASVLRALERVKQIEPVPLALGDENGYTVKIRFELY